VANRLTPGGTGGVGVNIRYLQRSGLTTPESVAAVTLVNVAGFIVHVLALAAEAGLLAGRAVEPVHLPHRGAVLTVFLAVTTLAGALFWSPLGRARVLPAARQAAQSLLAALRHPTQAILVLGGAVGVTGSYVLALLCSLRAFGATPPLLDVGAAYLVGTAIGAASPTPGGLGAIEAALVAVLLHFGVPGGPAVTGVLAFRLVTYWLPILTGVPAARALRRDGVL
jgi:undecaprenyl-diphosphatase